MNFGINFCIIFLIKTLDKMCGYGIMENLARTDRMRATEALKEKGVRNSPHPIGKRGTNF